jgi:hypothetical protein
MSRAPQSSRQKGARFIFHLDFHSADSAAVTRPQSDRQNSARKTSYETLAYLLFARRAAQRAFISCDNLLRPAAVSPPFFGLAVALLAPPVPLRLAHRALAAADSLARVLADIARRPARRAGALDGAGAPPKSEARRFSRASICRRIETPCSKDLRDRFIYTGYAAYSI